MYDKYYEQSTNLEEIIAEENIISKLDETINTLKNKLVLNKRTIFLDKWGVIIFTISTIISILLNLSILKVFLIAILNTFFCYSLYTDKGEDIKNDDELKFLEAIKEEQTSKLIELKKSDIKTNEYIKENTINAKEKLERFLLELKKKLLVLKFFSKNKAKLIKLSNNNLLDKYLISKNYSNEDIIFIKELLAKELTANNDDNLKKILTNK